LAPHQQWFHKVARVMNEKPRSLGSWPAIWPATKKLINAIHRVALQRVPQVATNAGYRPTLTAGLARLLWGTAMAEWDWAKAIGTKLRQDLGDWHAVPREMLSLLAQLRRKELTEHREQGTALAKSEPGGDAAGPPASPSGELADNKKRSPV
jgi:hypothetical protein